MDHIRLCSDKHLSRVLQTSRSPDVLIQSEGFIARDFLCLQIDKIWLGSEVQRLEDPSVTDIIVRWSAGAGVSQVSQKRKEMSDLD